MFVDLSMLVLLAVCAHVTFIYHIISPSGCPPVLTSFPS